MYICMQGDALCTSTNHVKYDEKEREREMQTAQSTKPSTEWNKKKKKKKPKHAREFELNSREIHNCHSSSGNKCTTTINYQSHSPKKDKML